MFYLHEQQNQEFTTSTIQTQQTTTTANSPQTSREKNTSAQKEQLVVSPKKLNVSQYKSFQIDCIYTGPNFLNVNLIWQKNGKNLDLTLNNQNQNRFLFVDYKQNNTRISILKFSYALANDSGLYKCILALDNQKQKSSLFLFDTTDLKIDKSKEMIYFCFFYLVSFKIYFLKVRTKMTKHFTDTGPIWMKMILTKQYLKAHLKIEIYCCYFY